MMSWWDSESIPWDSLGEFAFGNISNSEELAETESEESYNVRTVDAGRGNTVIKDGV